MSLSMGRMLSGGMARQARQHGGAARRTAHGRERHARRTGARSWVIVRVRAGKTAWRRFYDRGGLCMVQTRIWGRTMKRMRMDNRFQ